MIPQFYASSNTFVIIVADTDGEIGRFETHDSAIFSRQWEAFSKRAANEPGYREYDGMIQTDRMTFNAEDTFCPRVARQMERIAA